MPSRNSCHYDGGSGDRTAVSSGPPLYLSRYPSECDIIWCGGHSWIWSDGDCWFIVRFIRISFHVSLISLFCFLCIALYRRKRLPSGEAKRKTHRGHAAGVCGCVALSDLFILCFATLYSVRSIIPCRAGPFSISSIMTSPSLGDLLHRISSVQSSIPVTETKKTP